MDKKILMMVLAGLLGLAQAQAQNNSATDNLPQSPAAADSVQGDGHVLSVTAISRVKGDGRRLASVVLEYDAPIRNRTLSANSYQVEGKEVERIYANNTPARAERGRDGRYVIIEVEAELDLHASQPKPPTPAEMEKKQERARMQGGPGLRAGWSTGGDDHYPGNAVVTQVADIRTTKGKTYRAGTTLLSTVERCPVADDFRQEEFTSPYTGQVLPYNIYLPEDYDPAQQYPLVLFIHDAGVASGPVTHTLYQGNGATTWAEPEWQAKHKCIVVAPEYPVITVDDNWNYSHHLDATVALLRDLQTRYSIDPARIYTTGQSMGCMSSIVLMLKEPSLFAGALLVAGKWNPVIMDPIAAQNVWIISCEGDRSSNTLQSEAVARWRTLGAQVSEATWEMTLPTEELSQEADKLRAEGNHLLFTHLTGGSHRATWFIAYDIEGVKEWLFQQHK